MDSHLKRKEPDRKLYLDVLLETYDDFFQSEFAQVAIDIIDGKVWLQQNLTEENYIPRINSLISIMGLRKTTTTLPLRSP